MNFQACFKAVISIPRTSVPMFIIGFIFSIIFAKLSMLFLSDELASVSWVLCLFIFLFPALVFASAANRAASEVSKTWMAARDERVMGLSGAVVVPLIFAAVLFGCFLGQLFGFVFIYLYN